jgi:threonine/homoserine/homoserine lactone efflux protein
VDGLGGFVLVCLVLTGTPGPDDVLVLRSSRRGGARLGAATAAGAATGSLLWGAAAAGGLGEIVSRSPTAYDALRLGGACYLVALGAAPLVARVFRHPAGASGPADPCTAASDGQEPGGGWSAFATGLGSDLLNPKIGVFYVAVLPVFVPAGEPVARYALLLCAIDVALALTWLLALAWLARAAVAWLARPRVARWSGHLLNACLVGIGVAVAVGR